MTVDGSSRDLAQHDDLALQSLSQHITAEIPSIHFPTAAPSGLLGGLGGADPIPEATAELQICFGSSKGEQLCIFQS